jgi:hypothetical protein
MAQNQPQIDQNTLLDRIHTLEGAVFALAKQIDLIRRIADAAARPKGTSTAPATPTTDKSPTTTARPEVKLPKSAAELAELAAAIRFTMKETFSTLPGWNYAAMAGQKPKPILPRKPGYAQIDLERHYQGSHAHINRSRKHTKTLR